MNDFSELEEQLRNLRPMTPSPELVSRIEQGMAAEPARIIQPNRFQTGWISLGLGLAAAAVLFVMARVNLPKTSSPANKIAAAASANPPTTAPPPPSAQFIPDGATQVVYHTRDEGLHFSSDSNEPVRRVRSRTRETLHWRNPGTGASLLVSYPTEQVELIPVSGQ